MNGAVLPRACALTLVGVVFTSAQSQPAPQAEGQIAGIVNDVLAKTPIAGISVAIGSGAKVAYAHAFGTADREAGRPLDVSAVMDMGSIGKQITAAAVLKLVETGKVDLDLPLARYLPAWKDQGRAITIRQLLNHTSGLDDPPFSETDPEPRFLEPIAADRFLAFIQTAHFRFAPLEAWHYSNAGYQLLGLMLEAIHGKPYAQVIDDVLARRLRLDSLTWCDKKRSIHGRARDYMVQKGQPELVPAIDVSWFGGAGSLCSTASDLVRWEQALWRDQVLPRPLRTAMQQPAELRAGGATLDVGYGFARAFGSHRGHRKIGHPGTGAGITASLSHYPDDDLIIAVMVNTNGPGVPHAREIDARIAAALLRLEPVVMTPDVPATTDQTARWSGTYQGSYAMTGATFEACEGDGLCRSVGGKPLRLRHYGQGAFAGLQGPASELRFRPADGRAEWVVHTLHGIHDDVLKRVDDRARR